MQPKMLAVPSVLALVCAGGMFAMVMKARPGIPQDGSLQDAQFEWRHFVTPKMSKGAAAFGGKVAPRFDVKDSEGKPLQIGGAGLKQPEFVYFVNTECPCSYAAEPMFHSLRDHFDGKVDFICVTNGDLSTTKKWVNEMDVPYPAVPDKKLDIMRAYTAPASVYSALITVDGHVAKMWPGFSKGFLLDMNHEMAQAIGQPEQPFDTQYAPIKQATGCAFY